MKTTVCLGFILFLSAMSLSAQTLPEMGMAIRYEQDVEGLYATHRTHPFGTTLLVTNLFNDTQLEVQVGGRPSITSRAIVELSSLACDFLGIEPATLTQVQIDVVSVPAHTPAMRSRLQVEQTGIALVQSTGEDLSGAHPSIAINTPVVLTNTATGKTVTIVIKNRIPASRDRMLEISRAAAQALGIRGSGEVHLKTQ